MGPVHYPVTSEEAIEAGCRDSLERFGMRVTVEGKGRTVSEMPLQDKYLNLYGLPDGGILFYLADFTAGIAFLSAGGIGVTAGANVNFMRAARPGTETLHCRAEVKKMGRTICYASALVTDDTGTELGEYSFIFSNRAQRDA